ncbi:unnamed protein product [Fraxinus pennsylvanica]|uniref:Uncharacterized protein n=1 Tax=Fraxinus pennsylvanica TaxID=56036 RepID=A0AAD1ZCZ8_9LAMI|nr:unnamed protein product [Fraxinus pennsylvanica]
MSESESKVKPSSFPYVPLSANYFHYSNFPSTDKIYETDVDLMGQSFFPGYLSIRTSGEMKTFTPSQVLGMMLSILKGIAERNLNAAVVGCCIGIPIYFTDL